MSRSTSVNYSVTAENFGYANAGTDQFQMGDVQKLALAFENHDSSAGRGLPVARVKWTGATKTGNYTITTSDSAIFADATSGPLTITLPAAALGLCFLVCKTDASANAVTIAPAAGTISGAATQVLSSQYMAAFVISDATNWFIF